MRKKNHIYDDEQLERLVGRNRQIVSALRRLNQKVYEDGKVKVSPGALFKNFTGRE